MSFATSILFYFRFSSFLRVFSFSSPSNLSTSEASKSGLSTRISSNADKAGLEQCDKEKVNRVIHQSTKGTLSLPPPSFSYTPSRIPLLQQNHEG